MGPTIDAINRAFSNLARFFYPGVLGLLLWHGGHTNSTLPALEDALWIYVALALVVSVILYILSRFVVYEALYFLWTLFNRTPATVSDRWPDHAKEGDAEASTSVRQRIVHMVEGAACFRLWRFSAGFDNTLSQHLTNHWALAHAQSSTALLLIVVPMWYSEASTIVGESKLLLIRLGSVVAISMVFHYLHLFRTEKECWISSPNTPPSGSA